MTESRQAFDATAVLKRAVVKGAGFDAALIELDFAGLKGNSQALNEYAQATILRFLHKRLSPGDAILPIDDGVAVIFSDSEQRDLGASRERLQSSVNTLLTGDPRLQGLRATIRVFRLDQHAPAPKPAPTLTHPLNASFAPVWSVAHEMISTYFATAFYEARGGVHYGYSEEYRILGLHDDSNYLDIDLEILKRALAALYEGYEAGVRFVIGYSVHSTTLQSGPRRRAYMNELNKAPPELRRHLTGKIAEIESSVPRAAISEWVALLRQASSRISLEFSPNERRFEGLAATGAWAAGFLMPSHQPASERMHVDQHGAIARWRQGLSRQQMRFFVDDVVTAGAFDLACTEKVDFITSSVLWPAASQPDGMLRASRASARAAFGERRVPSAMAPIQTA